MSTSVIRIRMKRGATAEDIGALKKWLERERELEMLINSGALRIEECARRTGDNAPAIAGGEIPLVLREAVDPQVFEEVLQQAEGGVWAWRENRRIVESGEPPEVDVEPDDEVR